MFKRFVILCVVIALMFANTMVVKANTITAAADTYVTEGELGGNTSIHGTDPRLAIIGSPGVRCTPRGTI